MATTTAGIACAKPGVEYAISPAMNKKSSPIQKLKRLEISSTLVPTLRILNPFR
jgi:hypothetical protein